MIYKNETGRQAGELQQENLSNGGYKNIHACVRNLK